MAFWGSKRSGLRRRKWREQSDIFVQKMSILMLKTAISGILIRIFQQDSLARPHLFILSYWCKCLIYFTVAYVNWELTALSSTLSFWILYLAKNYILIGYAWLLRRLSKTACRWWLPKRAPSACLREWGTDRHHHHWRYCEERRSWQEFTTEQLAKYITGKGLAA